MDTHETTTDRGRKGVVGPAIVQLTLPIAVIGRIEIGHGEQAGGGIVTEQLRHGVQHDASHHLDPFYFEGVARDRHVPVGDDLELGQRTFDREGLRRGVDLPDIGGDAAGQRRVVCALAGCQQTHAGERRIEGGDISRFTGGFGHREPIKAPPPDDVIRAAPAAR